VSKEEDLFRLAREQVQDDREQAKAMVRDLGQLIAKPVPGTSDEDRDVQTRGRSALIKALIES
jgi:hypothetical protein